MNVYLIDDDANLRQAVARFMERFGFLVLGEACNGAEALSALAALRPDLIISDCQMPVMDGLSFARRFRALGRTTAMVMVSVAAALALVLGAVGLYGVLSYRVSRRAQEIGVRMALGAEAKSVRWMFVRQGGQVALIGVIVGALAAAALTTYIQTLLFNVGRFDLTAFIGMAAVMLDRKSVV